MWKMREASGDWWQWQQSAGNQGKDHLFRMSSFVDDDDNDLDDNGDNDDDADNDNDDEEMFEWGEGGRV